LSDPEIGHPPNLADGFGNSLRMDEAGFTITACPNQDVNLNTSGSGAVLNNGVPIGGGGSSLFKQASIVLSQSDLENLAATPIQIVAGKAGVYYALATAIAQYTFGTTSYSVDPNTFFSFNIGGSTAPFLSNTILMQENTVLSGLHDLLIDSGFGSISVGPPVDPADLSNVGIFITSYAGPDVTLGDGTVKVTVTYYEYTL
jgi:hypothetical protein